MDVNFLGEIPLDLSIRLNADKGISSVNTENRAISDNYEKIAKEALEILGNLNNKKKPFININR